MLAESAIGRLPDFGKFVPSLVRVETDAPVDDILVESEDGRFIFIQAKTSVDMSRGLNSSLGRAVLQFVEQWAVCDIAEGTRGWDVSHSERSARLILAVGPTSSGRITHDLALALRAYRSAAHAPLPEGQQSALDDFSELIKLAWQHILDRPPTGDQLAALITLVDVLTFDFEGADRELIDETMRGLLLNGSATAFEVLQSCFLRLMAGRRGADALGLRRLISGSLSLKEPPSYNKDVAALKEYSDRTREHLEHFEETSVDGAIIQIERSCTTAVLGALEESLLLVGEPGAGKSAVISSVAARLRKHGHEVLELAVDRLPVESAEGLQSQLGLENSVLSVLENWPGNRAAFLFIDALDATRGGLSASIFRWLIAEVLKLPGRRWRVIASIRSFDLRMGQQLAELFVGAPPNQTYSDSLFKSVRHILIPPWEERELDELLAKAPVMANAVKAGGQRLYDLARIPFNTRLLADLLSGGMPTDKLQQVDTQAQLLDLYWSYRVKTHGSAVEVSLHYIVGQMVNNRALQANRLTAAERSPEALDRLLKENVLVELSGGRSVAFRHHILFDFAASRLFLDLADHQKTSEVFHADRSAGLLLGPALIFALKERWGLGGADRKEFWLSILTCVGRPKVDPVIRSIAARVACELPVAPEDVQGLLHVFRGPKDQQEQAKTAVMHIVGSLSVRLEDREPLAVEAWSYFASELGPFVEKVAWPLRTLLFLLLEKCVPSPSPQQLGAVARCLFQHAFARDEQLTTPAIGFVAATYGADPEASRQLLGSLFEAERFNKHADDDIAWLTRALAPIAAADPDFVVKIYEETFTRDVTDDSATAIGQSSILRLTSNRRQDYQMAFWNLKEFFPRFLENHPLHGTQAYLKAIDGYIRRDHPLSESQRRHTMTVGSKQIGLWEDWSYIWASNPNDQNPDNALEISRAFSVWFKAAPPELALAATEILLSENTYGLVWARLFMVAAERSDVLGAVLWPIVTKLPFLRATDTRKDAVDLIVAVYPNISPEQREAFEREVLAQDFADANEPEKYRDYILGILFRALPADEVVTTEAREIAVTKVGEGEPGFHNERQISEVRSYALDDYWWLGQQGVDSSSSANAPVLAAAKALNTDIQPNARVATFPSLNSAVTRLTEFLANVDAQKDVDDLVRSHAEGIAADGLKTISSMFENEIAKDWESAAILIATVNRFVEHRFPAVTEKTEAEFEKSPSWGSPAPRVSAADAALTLARTGERAAQELRGAIEHFVRDIHPAVRMAAATHLNALWLVDRDFMWKQIDRVLDGEQNGSVLSFFADTVLPRLLHADPDRVEAITQRLVSQADKRKKLRQQIGNFVAILWISHGRLWPRDIVHEWLKQIREKDVELDHLVTALRGAVVYGYETNTKQDTLIRQRAIELADWVSAAAVRTLESYPPDKPLEDEGQKQEVTVCLQLLGGILNQLYFSSGAFRAGQAQNEELGLEGREVKGRYLGEIRQILERIIAFGSPQTIHYLISLLDFLIEADPKAVFDLLVNAVSGASNKFGYQYESLGADQVVKMVGRFLADHLELFDDPERRTALVKCLDTFIEAGWPSARRLLYRLPDLLQ